ncbi:6989_t:CDS:1, partial [Dentiscutata heterogama]
EFKYDKSSLHSCLLVNRLWCQIAVRFLWCHPFRLLYSCKNSPCKCSNEKRQSQAKNLIETYMSVIIYLSKNTLIRKQVITPAQVTVPVFNYLDFLQNIDLLELSATIHDGMNPKQNSEISKKPQFPPISQWYPFIIPS